MSSLMKFIYFLCRPGHCLPSPDHMFPVKSHFFTQILLISGQIHATVGMVGKAAIELGCAIDSEWELNNEQYARVRNVLEATRNNWNKDENTACSQGCIQGAESG
jgi:hypothetical protein